MSTTKITNIFFPQVGSTKNWLNWTLCVPNGTNISSICFPSQPEVAERACVFSTRPKPRENYHNVWKFVPSDSRTTMWTKQSHKLRNEHACVMGTNTWLWSPVCFFPCKIGLSSRKKLACVRWPQVKSEQLFAGSCMTLRSFIENLS